MSVVCSVVSWVWEVRDVGVDGSSLEGGGIGFAVFSSSLVVQGNLEEECSITRSRDWQNGDVLDARWILNDYDFALCL